MGSSPDNVSLMDAARIMGLAESPGAVCAEDQRWAIDALCSAPPQSHWDRALLLGLRSVDFEMVDHTVKACITRFERHTDAEFRDRFMGAILTACFTNLSGWTYKGSDPFSEESKAEVLRVANLEAASARLLRAMTSCLRRNPFLFEHHRSRLLARGRFIDHLEGNGELARAVVEFQNDLAAEGKRSDTLIAAEIRRHRKFHLYASPDSTEAALLAYLEKDRSLPLEEVTQELFRVYRFLLNYQSKERSRRALLAAMDNLMHWLDAIPFREGEGRDQLFEEMVVRARIGASWDKLALHAVRHLEAHLELLPGSDHPEDLLVLLQSKYASPESEDILIHGLELLRRLPCARLRTEEICSFVLASGKRERSEAVWMAFLDLVGSLITGLADFILTIKDQLTEKEQRRLRLMRKIFDSDARLRKLLYEISTDKTISLSKHPHVENAVREHAWRILLRSLPHDRISLYEKGLIDHDGRFVIATLQEAARHHQRPLWDLILTHRAAVLHPNTPAETRKARVTALLDFFLRSRNFDAVQNNGDQFGLMIGLALDDEDSEIREYARGSVIAAGYELELQREIQRRELLRLREVLTGSNEKILELESRIAELTQSVTQQRTAKVDHALRVQELLQDRDLLVTEGWITTAHIQVELEQVREALEDVLAQAREQSRILRNLQERIHEELQASRQIHDTTSHLVREQERLEREIERYQREQADAERQRRNAESDLSEVESTLRSLERSYPSSPSGYGNAEEVERAREQYEREVREHDRRISQQRNRMETLRSSISDCQRRIRHCENSIAQAESAHSRLSDEIEDARSEIRRLEGRLSNLRGEFRAGQATWEALRWEISRLRDEVQAIEERFSSKRSQTQSRLHENTQTVQSEQETLDQLYQQLRSLSAQLNQTSNDLDHQTTRSQELAQAIDSGRQNYDAVGEQAQERSALADATGVSLQRRAELEILEEQESRVHYSHSMGEALDRQPKPPTRKENKRHTRRPAQREKE